MVLLFSFDMVVNFFCMGKCSCLANVIGIQFDASARVSALHCLLTRPYL